jgi:hypothetical protein
MREHQIRGPMLVKPSQGKINIRFGLLTQLGNGTRADLVLGPLQAWPRFLIYS